MAYLLQLVLQNALFIQNSKSCLINKNMKEINITDNSDPLMQDEQWDEAYSEIFDKYNVPGDEDLTEPTEETMQAAWDDMKYLVK